MELHSNVTLLTFFINFRDAADGLGKFGFQVLFLLLLDGLQDSFSRDSLGLRLLDVQLLKLLLAEQPVGLKINKYLVYLKQSLSCCSSVVFIQTIVA